MTIWELPHVLSGACHPPGTAPGSTSDPRETVSEHLLALVAGLEGTQVPVPARLNHAVHPNQLTPPSAMLVGDAELRGPHRDGQGAPG